MKGIILSAGRGSRIGGKSKGLLPIDGKPLIQHQVDGLRDAGIDDIYVVVGHKADEFPELNVKYIYNDNYATKENSYSLFLALKEVGESSVVILDGDVMYDYRLFQSLYDTNVSFYYIDTSIARKPGDVGIDSKDLLVVNSVGKDKTYGVGCGITYLSYCFVNKLFAHMKDSKFDTWWINYVNEIIDDDLFYRIVEYPWAEIDTEEDYKKAKNIFESQSLEIDENDYSINELMSMYTDMQDTFTGLHLCHRDIERDKKAYDNSIVYTGRINGRVVAMSRVVTDGSYYAGIYDVMVRPEYQGRGYGKELCNFMIDRVKQLNPIKIFLFGSVGDKFDAFYSGLGFTRAKSTVWEIRND